MKVADGFAGVANILLFLGVAACVMAVIEAAREAGGGAVLAFVGVGCLVSGAILLGSLWISVSLQNRGGRD